MEFVLPAVAWRFQHFMQKHRKWTARLPLSAGCFLIAQAGYFVCCTTTVGFFWGIIILLKFHVPNRDFFSFKVLQNFIVYESAEDKNLRAFFNRVKNYYLFKIFPQFRLAKSTRIIHHNQLLMTEFGRILDVKTKMADTSLVSRVRTTAGTRRNNG